MIDRIAHNLNAWHATPLGFAVQECDLIGAKTDLDMYKIELSW